MCDYKFEEGGGECDITPVWAADQLKQCLATAQNADPVVRELATTAERCLDRSESRARCNEMSSKCTFTSANDVSHTPQYCGVAPLHVMITLLGGDGLAKVAIAATLCGTQHTQQPCDAVPSCARNTGLP